jgi:hypothetical protein
MDETRWREGLRATRASQPDTPERRAKRAQQIANMRQLRAHRKRMLDIGQVYRSDMYPRHFRRAVRPTEQRRSWMQAGDFYPIGELMNRPSPPSSQPSS